MSINSDTYRGYIYTTLLAFGTELLSVSEGCLLTLCAADVSSASVCESRCRAAARDQRVRLTEPSVHRRRSNRHSRSHQSSWSCRTQPSHWPL